MAFLYQAFAQRQAFVSSFLALGPVRYARRRSHRQGSPRLLCDEEHWSSVRNVNAMWTADVAEAATRVQEQACARSGTDAVSCQVVKELGWSRVAVLFVNDAYGRCVGIFMHATFLKLRPDLLSLCQAMYHARLCCLALRVWFLRVWVSGLLLLCVSVSECQCVSVSVPASVLSPGE